MNGKKEYKIEKTKLLIVEGEDERRFLNKWFIELEVTDIQVLPIGGKTKLLSELKILTTLHNFSNVESIGILRDADEDANAAFQSVCSALESCGLSRPSKVIERTTENPSISILILSGYLRTGSLEDIFIDSIRENPLMECIEQYFGCVNEKLNGIPNQIGKAKVHTFLAANINDPDKRLGESIEADIWNLDSTAFKLLREFIIRL
jgi:hypothetical protein